MTKLLKTQVQETLAYHLLTYDRGVAKKWAAILGVPIKRIIVYWGLDCGPHCFGNSHIGYGVMLGKDSDFGGSCPKLGEEAWYV